MVVGFLNQLPDEVEYILKLTFLMGCDLVSFSEEEEISFFHFLNKGIELV